MASEAHLGAVETHSVTKKDFNQRVVDAPLHSEHGVGECAHPGEVEAHSGAV